MTRSRWVVLVLVVVALGLSTAYGLRGKAPQPPGSSRTSQLQAAADLDPCPAGLGPALPKATLPCLGGGKDVRLPGAATGLPTVVNLYGSWCHPCYQEMPVLSAFADRARGKVALVGVDTEDDFDSALQFAKVRGQHWPALWDNDGVVRQHFAKTLPATLFLDATGKVVFVQRAGGYTSLRQLEVDVQRHLGVAL